MYQGRSQRGSTGANEPARLSGAPKILLAYAGSTQQIFLGCVLGLLQPTELLRSVRALSKTKFPAGAPWSGLGPILEAAGPLLETMGHQGH